MLTKKLYLDWTSDDGTKWWYWDDTYWVIQRKDGLCLMYHSQDKDSDLIWDGKYRTFKECEEILYAQR